MQDSLARRTRQVSRHYQALQHRTLPRARKLVLQSKVSLTHSAELSTATVYLSLVKRNFPPVRRNKQMQQASRLPLVQSIHPPVRRSKQVQQASRPPLVRLHLGERNKVGPRSNQEILRNRQSLLWSIQISSRSLSLVNHNLAWLQSFRPQLHLWRAAPALSMPTLCIPRPPLASNCHLETFRKAFHHLLLITPTLVLRPTQMSWRLWTQVLKHQPAARQLKMDFSLLSVPQQSLHWVSALANHNRARLNLLLLLHYQNLQVSTLRYRFHNLWVLLVLEKRPLLQQQRSKAPPIPVDFYRLSNQARPML